MNGIYPDYVGPTTAYRTASLYPDWIRRLGDVIPLPVDAIQGLASVKLLPDFAGVAKVASIVGALPNFVLRGALPHADTTGTETVAKVGSKVIDEEIGYD